jgi:hypothetical protein
MTNPDDPEQLGVMKMTNVSWSMTEAGWSGVDILIQGRVFDSNISCVA